MVSEKQSYWKKNLFYLSILLLVWFAVSFGAGILFVDNLNSIKFGWFGGGTQSDWWFGISPEGFGTFAMLLNFGVAIVVCNFTKQTPEDIQQLVEKIRLP